MTPVLVANRRIGSPTVWLAVTIFLSCIMLSFVLFGDFGDFDNKATIPPPVAESPAAPVPGYDGPVNNFGPICGGGGGPSSDQGAPALEPVEGQPQLLPHEGCETRYGTKIIGDYYCIWMKNIVTGDIAIDCPRPA